jgi:hypothetical protein
MEDLGDTAYDTMLMACSAANNERDLVVTGVGHQAPRRSANPSPRPAAREGRASRPRYPAHPLFPLVLGHLGVPGSTRSDTAGEARPALLLSPRIGVVLTYVSGEQRHPRRTVPIDRGGGTGRTRRQSYVPHSLVRALEGEDVGGLVIDRMN